MRHQGRLTSRLGGRRLPGTESQSAPFIGIQRYCGHGIVDVQYRRDAAQVLRTWYVLVGVHVVMPVLDYASLEQAQAMESLAELDLDVLDAESVQRILLCRSGVEARYNPIAV